MVDGNTMTNVQIIGDSDVGRIDRLRTACRQRATESDIKFLYVIVDLRADSDLHKHFAQVPEMRYVSLWHGSALESFTDIAPYIVAVDLLALEKDDGPQYRFLAHLCGDEADRHMLTWVWSPFHIDTLSEHFKRFCSYALPNRRAYYLHFYDNRVLPRLRSVWSSEEQRQFIAPANEIWYYDRKRGDVVWRNEHGPIAIATQPVQLLSDEQHELLLDLGYADKLALQLRNTCGALLDHLSDDDLYVLVDSQLERAHEYRISGDENLSSYVTTGVLVSPEFDQNPVVNERLLAVTRGEIEATEALSTIDDGIWDAIREN
jgi:hypothetical protein